MYSRFMFLLVLIYTLYIIQALLCDYLTKIEEEKIDKIADVMFSGPRDLLGHVGCLERKRERGSSAGKKKLCLAE